MTNTGQAGELDAAGGFRRRLSARDEPALDSAAAALREQLASRPEPVDSRVGA